MLPVGVAINPETGSVEPATGRYTKRLSELGPLYQDQAALQAQLRRDGDVLAYEVVEYKKEGSDICFGTTIMQPGLVGDEFFMTRGHFHQREDRGEVYYTQSGEGLLVLESREGASRTIEMRPGICAFIPPAWGHRSVNTGTGPLVFVWVCNADAGHDYSTITERGMRTLVVKRDGRVTLAPNPTFYP